MKAMQPPEVFEFAHQVGDFIEYWGFKNIQGQIWAHLYISAHPLDTEELQKRTQASRGLLSIYLKEMLEYEVIEEVGKSAKRTTLYRANKDQDNVIFNVLRKREQVMISKVKATLEQIESLPPEDLQEYKICKKGLSSAASLVKNVQTMLHLTTRSHKTIAGLVRLFKGAFAKGGGSNA